MSTLAMLLALAVPAEPAPQTHLYFATTLGAEWVYQDGKDEEVRFVVKVEPKAGETLVSVDRVGPRKNIEPHEKVVVSERGLFRVQWGISSSPNRWHFYDCPSDPTPSGTLIS